MHKTTLIGVDLGTSATKAAIYHPDGTLLAEASQEVPVYTLRPGVVEQENEDFYTSAAATVRLCLQESGIDPRQVAAIAFDSQMAGIGSIDENFKPATRFDSWLDMRCQPYIEWMDQAAGRLVTQMNGCPPSCNHGPKMLWWQHERPEEYARIARFIAPAGYVAGRMAGLSTEQAFIDYTFIHYSGVCDSQAMAWSPQLAALTGIDLGRMPRIVQPWEVIGEVTPTTAADFGLAPGTPIAAGCGDTMACALGAGVVRPGMLFDTAGTAAVLAACTERLVADTQHRALLCMHSVIPGLYHPLAYIAGGGLALRWFRDEFYNNYGGKRMPVESDLYEEMIAMALLSPPGAEGLMFSPHLGGRICPADPAMRGAWVGFSWGHTQAHFLRAILESIAFEYAYYLKILVEQLPELRFLETRAVGGGARSQAWNQLKADVLDVPYRRLSRNEFGTWGSALVAGKAAGLFTDLAAKAEETTQTVGESILPDAQVQEIYAPLKERYIALQARLAEHFNEEQA
jgi:xylulokinase